jgi:uncharacterized protein YdeI (YjbR/CyaY-like superfamily)
MAKRDPRVDAYIKQAQPFARPILNHIRKIVHAAVPGVEETIKWSAPAFEYKGPFCGVNAFKHYAVFGFWKGELLKDHLPGSMETPYPGNQFGKLTSVDDLPSVKDLTRIIKAAAKLNDEGIKAPPMRRAGPRPALKAPKDLLAALAKNKKAMATFENFAPGQRREYIAWVLEAKQAATRETRITTAVEWMAEGKVRNWKYVK